MAKTNYSKSSTICTPAEIEIAKWKKLIDKHEKCRKVPKKYKVVRKTDLDKLFHKVNVKNGIHYLTERRMSCLSKPGSVNATKLTERQDSSYETIYVPSQAFVGSALEKEDSDNTFDIIDNFKSKSKYSVDSNTNIAQRLHIPVKNFDLPKGITDVDEKYFSIVKNRCKKGKWSSQNYIKYLRQSLRLRLQTGYVFDEIYKLTEQTEIEKFKLKVVKKDLKTYKTSFNECLAEDHNQSMKPLLAYTEAAAETNQKKRFLIEKLKALSKVQTEIYSLEETWGKSKLCEEFLLRFFSILSGNEPSYYFTLKYATMNDDLDQENDIVSDNDSADSLFKFKSPNVVRTDLEFNFDDPKSLIDMFMAMEHQCLDYLMFTESLEKPNMAISAHLDTITKMYSIEILRIKQLISTLTNVISFFEQSNQSLQEHVRTVLNGLFKETFDDAEESILLSEYIRQTYVRCMSSTETSISISQMMTTLTEEYTHLLLEMDSISSDIVRKLVKEADNRENQRLKVAIKARREVHELETLTEQMLKMFKPVVLNTGRKLMYRSFQPVIKKIVQPPFEEISDEEKLYLYLFTDYCPYSDDAKLYLDMIQQDPELVDNKSQCFSKASLISSE